MQQPGVAKGVVGRIRDAAELARDERDRDGPRLPRQHGRHPLRNTGPQALDRGPGAQVPRRRPHTRVRLGRGIGVSQRAEPLEPGLAREVVVAGERRLGQRHEGRPQVYGATGLQPRRHLAGRDAHAVRPRLGRQIAHRRHPQRDALAALGLGLDELHVAAYLDHRHLLGQNRRAPTRRVAWRERTPPPRRSARSAPATCPCAGARRP